MKTTTGTSRRGRVIRSAEDRRGLIKRFKTSGQSQTEFCRENNVKLATFCHWLHDPLRKARQRKPRTRHMKFAEVQACPPGRVATGVAAPIEINLPSGVTIRLRDAGTVGDLVKFVKEAGSC